MFQNGTGVIIGDIEIVVDRSICDSNLAFETTRRFDSQEDLQPLQSPARMQWPERKQYIQTEHLPLAFQVEISW